MDRRTFCKNTGRWAVLAALAGGAGMLLKRAAGTGVPLINPDACKSCGGCTKFCILKPSAVKAVNDFGPCGYCVYCYGYFPDHPHKNPNARVCPTGALQRRKVGQFEYEYTIAEEKCIGCGACVKRCREHGNKSLQLMVRGRLCRECNRCRIVANCPNSAIRVKGVTA